MSRDVGIKTRDPCSKQRKELQLSTDENGVATETSAAATSPGSADKSLHRLLPREGQVVGSAR